MYHKIKIQKPARVLVRYQFGSGFAKARIPGADATPRMAKLVGAKSFSGEHVMTCQDGTCMMRDQLL